MNGSRLVRLSKGDHPLWGQPLIGTARILFSLIRRGIGRNLAAVEAGDGIRVIANLPI